MRRLILIAVTLFTPTLASADCAWRWDCSNGPCKQVQICASATGMPALPSLELPPIPPPSIRPLPSLEIPPIGATSCEQRYLCAGGSCSWRNVCR